VCDSPEHQQSVLLLRSANSINHQLTSATRAILGLLEEPADFRLFLYIGYVKGYIPICIVF